MSKHNKKNTLSFVILALLTAAPALTSAGGWLGGFRILAHLTAGLGFNIGKAKIKRGNLSISDALLNSFNPHDPSNTNDYFSATIKAIEDWNHDIMNSELVRLAKQEKETIGECDSAAGFDTLVSKLVNKEGKFKEEVVDRREQLRKSYDSYKKLLDKETTKPLKLPEETKLNIDGAYESYGEEKEKEQEKERSILNPVLFWSHKFLKDLGEEDDSGSDSRITGLALGDGPVFGGTNDYDCNVPSFWRRLEFSGEVSAIFQALDWFGIGLHGGLSGSLHQAELNDISRIRDSTNFSIKFGGVVQVTKWFQCAVMASADRHSLKRDALDINSTDSSDSIKKEIATYNVINQIWTQQSEVAQSMDKEGQRIKAAISQQTEYIRKEFIDSFEVSGWSWGIKIQPAFLLWFNESIGMKLGAEFTLPITEISSNNHACKYTPSGKFHLLIGAVVCIA